MSQPDPFINRAMRDEADDYEQHLLVEEEEQREAAAASTRAAAATETEPPSPDKAAGAADEGLTKGQAELKRLGLNHGIDG